MRRWVIVVLGVPVYTVVLMIVGTLGLAAIMAEDWSDLEPRQFIEVVVEVLSEPDWWFRTGPVALVMVCLQVVFLLPVLWRKPPREGRPKSLTASFVVAALVAGVLTMALGTAVISLVAIIAEPTIDVDDMGWLWSIPLAMLVGGWAFWSLLLFMFVRGVWADRVLGRLVGLLLAGTLIEALVVLPLDIMVRRRTSCYCGTGTFVTLSLAALATLWLVGPGIVIALTSRKHRAWRQRHCRRCAYPKGPSPGPACPECGYAWLDASRTGK
jgi:hypothetical protein